MMGNHGAVSYGEDVYKAFFRMETVEHFARISLVAELLGGATVLPKVEVEKLFDSRTRYGVKARAAMEPGCPVYAEQVPQAAPPRNESGPIKARGRGTVLRHARRTDRHGGRSVAGARRQLNRILEPLPFQGAVGRVIDG